MRPRSAGATWQGWERRDRRRRIARAVLAWLVVALLGWLTLIGLLTVIGFIIAIAG